MSIEDILDVGDQHAGARHSGLRFSPVLCVHCQILAADKGSDWCRHCHPTVLKGPPDLDVISEFWSSPLRTYVPGVS